jgi:hypothetical protein
LLHLKKKALFSAHGAPDHYQGHLLAFESHDSAPMGELRFPGDIIMVTLVAGDGHGAGYWFLATGCWLRVVCYGLRTAGCAVNNRKSEVCLLSPV